MPGDTVILYWNMDTIWYDLTSSYAYYNIYVCKTDKIMAYVHII